MKKINRNFIVAFIAMVVFMCLSLTGVSADTFIIENGFKYTRDSDGFITVHKYEGEEVNVTVPSTFVGQTVARVAEYAFMYNENVKSVSMPTTITSVDRGVFFGCTALESVNLPKNCTQIGQYMFYGCTELTSVSLPSVLKEVPRYCFSYCSSLESVTLPSTAKIIDEYAFSNCSNLKSVYVSKYTNYISPTAFENSPQVVIHGYMNTYAYQYAIENNIPFSPMDTATEIYYVTFYNYDGSVFQKIPVLEGNSIAFPSAVPVKPDTDTHYYEFSYWSGNVTNIRQNEFVYPVFKECEKEIEMPKEYAVVFLDGDGVFIKMDMVEEGKSAYEPAGIPTKKPSLSSYYIFTGWDTDFTGVTQNLIVRPVFEEVSIEYIVTFLDANGDYYDEQIVFYGEKVSPPTPPELNGYVFVGWDADLNYITSDLTVRPLYEEEPSEYTVKFLDFNGKTYEEFVVMYGETVYPPTLPEVEGYTFVGWDQDVSFVTGDMVVTPVYEKIKVPVVPPTTGTLKVEVSGGTSFTISVNGGAARPQGASYMNTKMPIGAVVTLTAVATNGAEFIGWISPANGLILTTDLTYTFTFTGNDSVKATFATKIDGVQLVKFYNDKSYQVVDMQYYASTDAITFPAEPSFVGYDFAGWSMTEAEIQAAIANGENVTVVAQWTRQIVYVNVTVTGGTGGGKALANTAYIVTANAAPEGQKFAYWIDGDGNIKSYLASYKFFPVADIELIAVFVDADTVVEEKILASVDTTTKNAAGKTIFTYSWYCPDSYTFVDAGIIAVDAKLYNEATFYVGTSDSNVQDRGPSGDNIKPVNTFTWTKTIPVGDTWYAKCYVQYRDAEGNLQTVYSDMYEVVG